MKPFSELRTPTPPLPHTLPSVPDLLIEFETLANPFILPSAGTFGTFSNTASSSADLVTVQGQGFTEGDISFSSSTFNLGRRQDIELFENYFGEGGDTVFQDMDLNNMMSWVLSPNVDRS